MEFKGCGAAAGREGGVEGGDEAGEVVGVHGVFEGVELGGL